MDQAAISAWNLMRGIDWAAIPVLALMLGVEDIESFVRRLCALRDAMEERDNPPDEPEED